MDENINYQALGKLKINLSRMRGNTTLSKVIKLFQDYLKTPLDYMMLGTVYYDFKQKDPFSQNLNQLYDYVISILLWNHYHFGVKDLNWVHLVTPDKVEPPGDHRIGWPSGQHHFYWHWAIDPHLPIFRVSTNKIISELPDPSPWAYTRSEGFISVQKHTTLFYFEISVRALPEGSAIAVGLVPSLPGMGERFVCFSDDAGGGVLGGGETVGCGVNGDRLFFVYTGGRMVEVEGRMPQMSFNPAVGMKGPSEWHFNFGESPFTFRPPFNKFSQGYQPYQPNPSQADPTFSLSSFPQYLYPLILQYSSFQDISNFLSTSATIQHYLSQHFFWVNRFLSLGLLCGYYEYKDILGKRILFILNLDHIAIPALNGVKVATKYKWELQRARNHKECFICVPSLHMKMQLTSNEQIQLPYIHLFFQNNQNLTKFPNRISFREAVHKQSGRSPTIII